MDGFWNERPRTSGLGHPGDHHAAGGEGEGGEEEEDNGDDGEPPWFSTQRFTADRLVKTLRRNSRNGRSDGTAVIRRYAAAAAAQPRGKKKYATERTKNSKDKVMVTL